MSRAHSRHRHDRSLRFEPLEDRRLLSASPIVVTTLADTVDFNDGVTSLREAIFAANTVPGADTITFAPALTASGPAKILLTQGELTSTDALTITGSGADLLTIDASGNSQGTSVLVFRDSDPSTQFSAAVSGLTLTGGNRSRGGGILSYENLAVKDCVITGNSGHDGAAIYSFHGILNLQSSTVTGNSSDKSLIGAFLGDLILTDSTINANSLTLGSRAGIVYAISGNLSIAHTTISSNSSDQSPLASNLPSAIGGRDCDVTADGLTVAQNKSLGGFSMQNSTTRTIQFTNSTFADNDGAGIFISNRGTTTITNCSISGNGNSGAVLGAAGITTLADSLVFNNRGNVGGISAGSGAAGSLLITGCKVFNNAGITTPPPGSLGGGGGATIAVATGGQATIVDSSFYGNTKVGDGGGVSFRVASGATGTITGCAIYGNSGDQGGGVLVAGNALLQQSTITGNTAYSGAGIYTYRLNDGPYIADCQISNNTAFYGGGILVAGPGPGTTTIARCDISFNVANQSGQPDSYVNRTGQGGGIYAGTALPSVRRLIITNSSITHNQAARHGGGIFGGAPQILASTISDNSAQIGGGLMMQGVISDSTISGNSAVEGAGIYSKGITVSRSTIAANKATGSGGGVFLAAGTLTLGGSILQNTAPSGPDIAVLAGSTVDAHDSLVHSNGQSGLAASPPGAPDANGNLIGGTLQNSISALIGPLVYNGGPVLFDGVRLLSHAPLPGSPAINAGDPTAAAGIGNVPQFDERGIPFMRIAGGRIDMGAVESQPNPLPGDYNFDGIVDAADYTVWVDSQFTNQVFFYQIDLRADGNGDGLVNQADYDVWKAHFGDTLPAGAGAASASVLTTPIAAPSEVATSIRSFPVPPSAQSSPTVAGLPSSFPPRSLFLTADSAHDSALLIWLAAQPQTDRPITEVATTSSSNFVDDDEPTDSTSGALDTAFTTLVVNP